MVVVVKVGVGVEVGVGGRRRTEKDILQAKTPLSGAEEARNTGDERLESSAPAAPKVGPVKEEPGPEQSPEKGCGKYSSTGGRG